VDGRDWDRLADQVRADGIDILVDLKGHFDDNHLPLFARRPAPVQATWLGYPDSTGLSCIDAWLTDAPIIEGAHEQQASEQLVALGPFFMCFRPAPGAPPVSALPALARGHVTFGCFNTWSKVSPAMREAMVAILRAVPDSRLLVTAVPGGDTRTRFLEYLGRQGLDPGRVEIRGRGSHADFIHAHDEVDITLDSFPYNGTTTALHSLWMGVPFVTLGGTTHVSRVGQSILRNVGLDAWVASSVEDYVRLAASHASELAALAALRGELRLRLEQSVIMDEAGFTRRLEAAYTALWRDVMGAYPTR
jgi:predicted O-linked N-acetylglucosamine transferase (SPINDLY family)